MQLRLYRLPGVLHAAPDQQKAVVGVAQVILGGIRCRAAVNYINSRRFREALNTLDQINERSAIWYYLSSCANAGLGNNVLARDHAAQAVNMEPNNMQYRQLLNQLNYASSRYQNSSYGNGYSSGTTPCGTGNMCCDLFVADSLCECMGGDLCSCM